MRLQPPIVLYRSVVSQGQYQELSGRLFIDPGVCRSHAELAMGRKTAVLQLCSMPTA
jgi:hypothetical protein